VKPLSTDTIAAITTAMGAAGVGIIRISGDEAADIADKVIKTKKGTKIKDIPSHRVSYAWIIGEEGELIDEALVLTMRAPHSYTGEDVVEIQCHGGIVVLRKVLDLVLRAGSRLAKPGEFSKRAFLNGKLDITQAEAIMDMVNAKTEVSVKAAANNLQGSIALKIKEVRDDILSVMAYLEAEIDFPEEDLEKLPGDELVSRIKRIDHELAEMLKTYRSGRIFFVFILYLFYLRLDFLHPLHGMHLIVSQGIKEQFKDYREQYY
jgi:tRNA modification GTPase